MPTEFDGSFTLCPYYKRNGVIRGAEIADVSIQFRSSRALAKEKNGFHSNSLERGQLGGQEKDLQRKKKPTAEKIASNDIRAALDLTLTEKIIT